MIWLVGWELQAHCWKEAKVTRCPTREVKNTFELAPVTFRVIQRNRGAVPPRFVGFLFPCHHKADRTARVGIFNVLPNAANHGARNRLVTLRNKSVRLDFDAGCARRLVSSLSFDGLLGLLNKAEVSRMFALLSVPKALARRMTFMHTLATGHGSESYGAYSFILSSSPYRFGFLSAELGISVCSCTGGSILFENTDESSN